MKTYKIMAAMALAAAMLPMAACTDDVPQTVRLNIATEGSNKGILNNRYTYFDYNDRIAINDQQYTLVSDGNGGRHWADVQVPINGNSFVAFFPTSIQAEPLSDYMATNNAGTLSKTVKVKFPRVYECAWASYAGDRIIDIPMVALAKTTDNQLYFRHAGAVIGLTLTYDITEPEYAGFLVDSVMVYGRNGIYLSGTSDATITDGASGTLTVADLSSENRNRRVSVHYDCAGGLGWIGGNRRNEVTLPIPIAPNSGNGKLDIYIMGKWKHNGVWQPVTKAITSVNVNHPIVRNKYYTISYTITSDPGSSDPGESNLSIEDHTPWGNLW